MFEGAPEHESLSKEVVIESLRQNREDLSMLIRYMEEKEAGFKESRDYLNLNIEKAEILREAGMLEEAYEAFLDARDQAHLEGDDELAAKLLVEANKLAIQ